MKGPPRPFLTRFLLSTCFFFSSSKFLLFVLAPCERTELECPGQRRVSEPACWDGEERWNGSKALITSKFSLFSRASTYPPLHPFRSLLCVGPICRPSCCECMLHFEVPSLGEAKWKRRLNPLGIIQLSCSQRAGIIYRPSCIITLERQRYNLLFFCEDENFEFFMQMCSLVHVQTIKTLTCNLCNGPWMDSLSESSHNLVCKRKNKKRWGRKCFNAPVMSLRSSQLHKDELRCDHWISSLRLTVC